MRRILSVFALFIWAFGAFTTAQAQQQDPLETGILAFREARYPDAVTAFEKAVDQDPENAEAHFLLARIYFETSLRDTKKAGKELDRALDIEPDNVQYLVARLEQYRVDSWNFFSEMMRERKRRELSEKILKLDSTNAFAHEELGTAYIRDFWRYRNAFMYPTLSFREQSYRGRTDYDPLAGYLVDQIRQMERDIGQTEPSTIISQEIGAVNQSLNPNAIFLADKFDIQTLEAQGIPVQDLSKRAQTAYDKAIGHLEQALDTDPRHRSIYDHMMQIYALKGEDDAGLKMLEQMYVFFPEETELWTYLGLAHYRVGNMDAASKAFQTAFEYMDHDMSYAYSRLDDILPLDEKEKYKQDEVTYASQFWTSKDPRYLTPYNERKMEHYARLTYADLLYGAPDLNIRGWNTERGRILVRYGTPKGDVVIIPKSTSGIAQGLSPSSGTSSDPSGSVSSALIIGREGTDFDMLEEANTYNIWDYGEFRFVFEDPFRNGEYRLYSPPAQNISQGAVPWINDYTIRANDTFRSIPELYDYEAPGRQIEMPYLVASFKGDADRTDVYVNYGVPITQFDPNKDLINLTANAGMFLISKERDILVEQRRTIYGLKTEQIVRFEETNLWVDSQPMSAPPGDHQVSVEFETTGGGTVAVQRRDITVPDFNAEKLALSDVLLAYRIEETDNDKPLGSADIVRNNLSMMPAPWSVFSHEQPIYMYFEVYNLKQNTEGGTDYEVEAFLVPKDNSKGIGKLVKGIFGGDDKGVSVRLPVVGATPDDNQYLILDASNQETGLYTLVLKVKDNISGKDVDMEQDLFLE